MSRICVPVVPDGGGILNIFFGIESFVAASCKKVPIGNGHHQAPCLEVIQGFIKKANFLVNVAKEITVHVRRSSACVYQWKWSNFIKLLLLVCGRSIHSKQGLCLVDS